jgi:hypothetical protein
MSAGCYLDDNSHVKNAASRPAHVAAFWTIFLEADKTL